MKKLGLIFLVAIFATVVNGQRPNVSPQDYYEAIATCQAKSVSSEKYIQQLELTVNQLQKQVDDLKAAQKSKPAASEPMEPSK